MIVFAQVSDLHLDGSERAAERTRRVIDYVNSLELDAVLVTGDLADHGWPEEYAELTVALKSPHPMMLLPGNHDRREAYREGLLGEPADGGPINVVQRVGDVNFLLADSTIPGRSNGFLAEETLAWVDSTLAADAASPAFVCFHHPPVALHSPLVDVIRLDNAARLAEVLGGHRNVVAVLCGHAHTAATSTFAGVPLLVAPGVVSTLTLPAEPRPDVDLDLPPALYLHVLDDERRLTTHCRVVVQDAPRTLTP